MFLPILYTVLTTICAFLSLIFSGIKPIIDFGWMMTLGLTVSICVTFFLLPSLLNIFATDDDINVKNSEKSIITSALSNFSKKNTAIIFSSTLIILILRNGEEIFLLDLEHYLLLHDIQDSAWLINILILNVFAINTFGGQKALGSKKSGQKMCWVNKFV